MSHTIFTSTGTRQGQASPPSFRDYGNLNQVPCPVSESGVNIIATPTSTTFTIFAANLASIISTQVSKKVQSLDKVADLVPIIMANPSAILVPPQVVVAFEGREQMERVRGLMERHNFRKEVQARQSLYKGTPTVEFARECIDAGGDLNTYAAYGVCNLNGYFTSLISLQFALWYSALFKYHASSHRANFPILFGASESGVAFTTDITEEHKVIITTPSEVPRAGVFFPYFPGLVLPDKHYPASVILRHFGKGLGLTLEQRTVNSRIIRNGWISLSTTPAGLALSHLLFVLDISIQTGTKPYFLIPSKNYQGVVLCGKIALVKGLTTYRESENASALRESISLFSRHNVALKEIAEQLSAVKPRGADQAVLVTADDIPTPRKLHNLIRERDLSVTSVAAIRTQVEFLTFPNDYYDLGDNSKLVKVAEAFLNGTFLDSTEPIAYKTDALFAKDPVYSGLAAFGPRVPVLSVGGPDLVFPVKGGGKFFQTGFKSHKVRGIPIYYLALQQGFEKWSRLIHDGYLSYKLAGKDKEEYHRFPACARYMSMDDDEARNLQAIMSATISQKAKEESDKKRKRAQEEENHHNAESGVKAKKKRSETGGGVAAALFGAANTVPAEPVDDQMSGDEGDA